MRNFVLRKFGCGRTNAGSPSHMFIISSRVRPSKCANTINGDSWLCTEQTCLRQGRAEHWQHLLDSSNLLLLPLLIAEVADTNSVPLIVTFIRATWNWDRVRCALTAEYAPTTTAMVPAVEYGELCITVITDSTTVVRHPEVPRDILGFGPARQPWCQKLNYISKSFIWGFHGWLQWYRPKETLMLASSSAPT
jgi:hypothetical protein